MRFCARAIVIRQDQILLIKRLKMGRVYYTLPGGTVERSETPDQAAIREIKEESTIDIDNPTLVFIEDAGEPYGKQYVYLCNYVSGEPELPDDSEEAFWTVPGKNTYEPLWFDIDKLDNIDFVSPLLREAIVMGVKAGWPKEPYEFSSKHANRLS